MIKKLLAIFLVVFTIFLAYFIFSNEIVIQINPEIQTIIQEISSVQPGIQENTDSNNNILPYIRQSIIPNLVQIECFDDGGISSGVGTGTYVTSRGRPTVQTNSHVIIDDFGSFNVCNVYFPDENGVTSDIYYIAEEAQWFYNKESVVDNEIYQGADYALLTITSPGKNEDGESPIFPPESSGLSYNICETGNRINFLGQSIYQIGYWSFNPDAISIEKGVISSFDSRDERWILSRSRLGIGASGGIAVADSGCVLGIPTAADSRGGSSLSTETKMRILSKDFVENKFLPGLTGKEVVFEIDLNELSFEDYFDDVNGFLIKHPLSYDKQILGEGSFTYVGFTPPKQGDFDYFDESIYFSIDDSDTKTIDKQIEIIRSQGIEDSNVKSLSDVRIAKMAGLEAKQFEVEQNDGVIVYLTFVVKNDRLYTFGLEEIESNPVSESYREVYDFMLESLILFD